MKVVNYYALIHAQLQMPRVSVDSLGQGIQL